MMTATLIVIGAIALATLIFVIVARPGRKPIDRRSGDDGSASTTSADGSSSDCGGDGGGGGCD